MDEVTFGQRGPASDILRLLQRRGPQSIKELEAQLGVSTNAVREQIQHLLGAGLIDMDKVRRGAGRPAHVYSLSGKAQSLFSHAYEAVLKLLLEELTKTDGPDRAQSLLNAVGERLADDFTGGVRSCDLREQVDNVVTALGERGIPMAVLEHEDVVALQAWSCPYYSLARDHRGVCEMEQHMLERALGARVTIAQRMIDGHVGCKFLVERE